MSWRAECCEGSLLGVERPFKDSRHKKANGTYLDTEVMTCESCAEPITDTFALGHIHKNLGEYYRIMSTSTRQVPEESDK